MTYATFLSLLAGLTMCGMPPPTIPDWVQENNEYHASVASGGVIWIRAGGSGRAVQKNEQMVLDFTVVDAAGDIVATTQEDRFLYRVMRNSDPLWEALTIGMRKGEVRVATLSEAAIKRFDTEFSSGPGTYSVRYRLVEVIP